MRNRTILSILQQGGVTEDDLALLRYNSLMEQTVPQKNQSFGQAFSMHRKAGDKEFTWKGKRYTTQLKDEVSKKGNPSAPNQPATPQKSFKHDPELERKNLEELRADRRTEREDVLYPHWEGTDTYDDYARFLARPLIPKNMEENIEHYPKRGPVNLGDINPSYGAYTEHPLKDGKVMYKFRNGITAVRDYDKNNSFFIHPGGRVEVFREGINPIDLFPDGDMRVWKNGKSTIIPSSRLRPRKEQGEIEKPVPTSPYRDLRRAMGRFQEGGMTQGNPEQQIAMQILEAFQQLSPETQQQLLQAMAQIVQQGTPQKKGGPYGGY